ncbi:hypothetical protein KUTeg_012460 [Tegillarca granosa]|uniref:Uncharacterized protein n=1 Tax=Tegillarca granosa TaxID=220873 RepID=A0ABQ9EZL0_TEGGR|nr:hypothetical protein KUTeg_012460 [Tegillarca granosa]
MKCSFLKKLTPSETLSTELFHDIFFKKDFVLEILKQDMNESGVTEISNGIFRAQSLEKNSLVSKKKCKFYEYFFISKLSISFHVLEILKHVMNESGVTEINCYLAQLRIKVILQNLVLGYSRTVQISLILLHLENLKFYSHSYLFSNFEKFSKGTIYRPTKL